MCGRHCRGLSSCSIPKRCPSDGPSRGICAGSGWSRRAGLRWRRRGRCWRWWCITGGWAITTPLNLLDAERALPDLDVLPLPFAGEVRHVHLVARMESLGICPTILPATAASSCAPASCRCSMPPRRGWPGPSRYRTKAEALRRVSSLARKPRFWRRGNQDCPSTAHRSTLPSKGKLGAGHQKVSQSRARSRATAWKSARAAAPVSPALTRRIRDRTAPSSGCHTGVLPAAAKASE